MVSQGRLDAINEAVEVDDTRPGPGAVPQLVVVVVELVPGEHEVFPLPVVCVDHPLGGQAPQIATGSGTGYLGDCRNILKQRSQSWQFILVKGWLESTLIIIGVIYASNILTSKVSALLPASSITFSEVRELSLCFTLELISELSCIQGSERGGPSIREHWLRLLGSMAQAGKLDYHRYWVTYQHFIPAKEANQSLFHASFVQSFEKSDWYRVIPNL